MSLPDLSEDTLTVELEAAGVHHDKFLSYSLSSAYLTPTDGWEFVVANDDDPVGLRRRWRPWQPVKLSIAGRQQVLGRIDGNEGTGPSGSWLKVWGRDYLADIVDSTVDPQFQVKQGWDIGQFLLELLAPWGIKQVFGDVNQGALNRNLLTGKRPHKGPPSRDFKTATLSDFKAEENEGVMEYANRILARHRFTLQPAGSRDAVVVGDPNYIQDVLCALNRPGNNIKTGGCAKRDYTNVPTMTLGRGRSGEPGKNLGGTKGQIGTFDPATARSNIGLLRDVQRTITSDEGIEVVRQKRFDPKKPDTTVYGYDQPVYKPLFYRDKSSKNQEQVEAGVARTLAEKLRETLTYSGEVRGHTDPATGATWAVDTLVSTRDEIEDVDEVLWVGERTFSNDGSGPMTAMQLYRPESFVL